MARELILKLGKMITDRMEIQLGLEELDENSPEYIGLAEVVTDEQAEIALAMGKRKPTTANLIARKIGKDVPYVEKQLDAMSKLGLLEYDRQTEDGHKQWYVPHFVVGSGEFMALHQIIEDKPERYEDSPRIQLFERMAFLPLKNIIQMVPPGGAGIGMQVIPVKKEIPVKAETPDYECLTKLLDRYDGRYAVAPCVCRATAITKGEATGEVEEECCMGIGDAADYIVETGLGRYVDREEMEAILQRCEDNGYVHQFNRMDADEKISFICNCHTGTCLALRTSQLFNAPNLSASAYRAHVDPEKCAACGKCAEVCPAGAAKLGQRLCTKTGPVVYPKARTANDSNKWTEDDWNKNYRNDNTKVCHETGTAPCKAGCPAHVAVQGYINLAAQGRYMDALKLIKQDNPFPAICGSICNRRCEDACTRGCLDAPVAIDEIKKFIAEQEINAETRYVPEKRFRKGSTIPYGDRIAVIGAGPAGLSCAYYLALWGYENVTVYDKNKVPGGMLALGIPSFRLEKEVINAEIEVLKAMGVNFSLGVEIGKDITLEQLRSEGTRAFFLAIGAQNSAKLGIPGENAKNVFGGVEFLREVNLGERSTVGKKVAVVGGGNVAMDVARTAVRLGAEEVTVIYRRSAEEMPADPEEVAEAEAEGVKFMYLAAPVGINKTALKGSVNSIKVELMELGEPDEKGRRKPVGTGKYEVVKVNAVISAIGQTPDWGSLDTGALEKSEKGLALADARSRQSAQADIFVGGDILTGPKFAIDAIAAGREGAESIHRFVHRGHDLTLGRDFHEFTELDKSGVVVPVGSFDVPERAKVEHDAAKVKTMKNNRVTLTAEQVAKEASRCLGCGISVVDTNRCIGCGLCTTRCEFDAIHLYRDNPECSELINMDDQLKAILPYAAKKAAKLTIKKLKSRTTE